MMKFRLFVESTGWELYHGSNSEQIVGKLRVNERDAGWFGTGFYLSAYPSYSKKWGKYVYKMAVPQGKFAEVVITGNYENIDYLGDAKKADQEAGGSNAWIENEHAWAQKFTQSLASMGYDGVRVHFPPHKDAEVLVFNPSNITVLGREDG